MSVQPSFIFGGDTGVKTPEDLARLRAIADALRGPVAPKTVGQGLSAIGEALGYRMADSRATNAAADWKKGGDSVFSALFGGGGAGDAKTAAAGPAETSVASPGLGGSAGPAPDLSGNDIYSGFMDTVKGKITNPNALAAVAATGKAESGFSPGNAFRSWSDPSQSGQAGAAGGIMSWRAERLANMKKFAADNGGDPDRPSPQLQAAYFLQEDPGLIDRLNAAKSPAEAQQLMNNAWKFAGYDRPGGEAGRRIALANSFASQFSGSPSAPVNVASLDPSAGMASTAPGGAVAAALAGRPVPQEYASKGVTQDQWDKMNAPDGAPQGNAVSAALAGKPPVQAVQSPRAADGGAPVATPAPVAAQAPGGGVKVAGGGPTVQQLMQAATDPRLSAEQRGVVGILLKQKMAESDPATQLSMEKDRLDMEKTRIETERLKNPQMTPAEKARLDFDERKLKVDQDKLIEVGGSLVDPNTHQAVYTGQQTDWEKLDDGTLYNKRTGETKAVAAAPGGGEGNMFKGNAVDAQALNWLVNNNKVTREQAAQIAAGKTITDPTTGAMMFLTPSGIVAQMPGQKPQPIVPPTDAQLAAAPGPAQAAPPAAQTAPAPVSPRADDTGARPGIIPLTDPKLVRPTETQRNRKASVDQAFDAINGELDRFTELVGKTGIEAMPGKDKDNLNTVRQGVMLQLKELFNLGVLNGPDLGLMEKMIYDPVVDPLKEGGLANMPGQLYSAVTGDAKDRTMNSVAELKRMLEGIKASVGKTIVPPESTTQGIGADNPYKSRYGLD